MKKLIIVQTVIPDYRKYLFIYIKSKLDDLFELYSGGHYFQKSVKTDNTITFRRPIKNIYLFNRKFLYQLGIRSIVFKPNILIMELNPRIISNWIILVIRRILKRRTILWGHAWPRSGADNISDKVRGIMRNLGDQIIVYTEAQKHELKKKMPRKIIKVAPNALYHYSEMYPKQINPEECTNFIYVGRLVKNKKPAIMLEAFAIATQKLPIGCKLIVIGDGPERVSLEQFTKNHYLEERIIFKGHVSDYEILKKHYAESIASISPGYLGLSVTQSLGFGVPIIVSKNEPHSPEIEALIENENYSYFDTDNLESLTNMYIKFYNHKLEWFKKRDAISQKCRNSYSIEKMAEPFLKIFSE